MLRYTTVPASGVWANFQSRKARQRMPVVGGDHVAPAVIGMTTGAVGIEQHGFLPGRELDDAVVDIEARILGDLLFDEEPLPALVDLTLVVVDALRRKVGE